MRTFPQIHRRIVVALVLMLVSVASSSGLNAQTPDARWQAWLGCWSARDGQTLRSWTGTSADGLVCIVPATSGEGVEVAVVANGKVVHREGINATGQRASKTVESCPGWESGTWSADNRRLMLRSEFTCGQTVVTGSSVFSISSEGDWIEVRGTTVGRNAAARAVRYRSSGYTLAHVAGGASADSVTLVTVPKQAFAARYARQGAGEPVRTDAVLEVAKAVDGQVAEAWLNELGQGFVLNARELVRLADAGMPSRMVDLMVALSYPARFAVQRQGPDGAGSSGWAGVSGGAAFGGSRMRADEWNCRAGYMPTTYSYYYGDPCMPGYYGYGQGYGYGRYDYGLYNGMYSGAYNGYYYGPRPIVIVPNTPSPSTTVSGQAVNGAGYTRRDGGQVSTPSSQPRASSGDASSSSGTQSSAPASSSSGSGGNDGRTAKPRVPPG